MIDTILDFAIDFVCWLTVAVFCIALAYIFIVLITVGV